jgi:uncharacterized protein
MHAPSETPRPWYREFWVWFLISPAVMGVVAGLSLLAIASHSPDPLVVDDYYKEGRAINRVLERDRLARELGLRADIGLDAELALAHVALRGKAASSELVLRLVHPTRADYDLSLPLQRLPAGGYAADLPPLRAGRWHLILEPREDPHWRLTGRVTMPGDGKVVLGAAG